MLGCQFSLGGECRASELSMDSLALAAIRVTDREGSPQVAIRAILDNVQLKPVLNGNLRILLQFIEQRSDRAKHLEQELSNPTGKTPPSGSRSSKEISHPSGRLKWMA